MKITDKIGSMYEIPNDLIKNEFDISYIVKPNGCWEWIGEIATTGYGILTIKIQYKELRVGAHRISAGLYHGMELIKSNQALHRCDYKRCVNPEHLYVGDHIDNIRDRAKRNPKSFIKSRNTCPKGHPYNYFHGGKRSCSICRIKATRRWRAKNKCV